MKYSQAEKMEIIRLVEGSELPKRQTLRELDVNHSSFYQWYGQYKAGGYDALAPRDPCAHRFWNKIPKSEQDDIVSIALSRPGDSPRELAWHITDTKGYFISESSVYRILKSFDLVTSPCYIVMSAADKFSQPTTRVHEMWQTDFTYFRIVGWGWYYLGTILDDYSRYIIAWKLYTTMATTDVTDLLEVAIGQTGVDHIEVKHRPRLLSDNGPAYVSSGLREYLDNHGMTQTHGAPYHPMTQGKIERYHRSMKNVINLQKYWLPGELGQEIDRFVQYYNNQRYHESLDNVTPADVYYGRQQEIITRREKLKRRTLKARKKYNLSQTNRLKSSLSKSPILSKKV
jgi:transposase InsO family protein